MLYTDLVFYSESILYYYKTKYIILSALSYCRFSFIILYFYVII